MNRLLLFISAFFILVSKGYGQAPGLVVQAGLTSLFSQDPNITPKGQGHYGWTVGADARLLDGDLYFILGGFYHSTTIAAKTAVNPLGTHDWGILSGRFGVGFNILRLSEKIAIRSKILCSINFNSKIPKTGFVTGYEKVNDSFLGVGSGLGLTLGRLEFDLEYQHGLLNAYNKKKDTNFNIISLIAGIRF